MAQRWEIYRGGDIVWVKLNLCWWPGELIPITSLPRRWFAHFKYPPVAAVKFFNEDLYEYLKSAHQFYGYNCSRKYEFIKKGMCLRRTRNSIMDKFPRDVMIAEGRTNGDPTIVNDPRFLPEKKESVAAQQLKKPKKNKRPKKTSIRTKQLPTNKNKSIPTSSKVSQEGTSITHPRSVGHKDFEVRFLIQGQDKEEESDFLSQLFSTIKKRN